MDHANLDGCHPLDNNSPNSGAEKSKMYRQRHSSERRPFFDDPFFSESWTSFDSAMQRASERMNRDDKNLDEFKEGRRTINPGYKPSEKEVNPRSVEITEKDGTFQAILDVRNFDPHDLQVRAREDAIIVEGKYCDEVCKSGTMKSSESFYKEFKMPPEANVDLVSTTLSKEGILTIKAPRKQTSSSRKPQANDGLSKESFPDEKSDTGYSSSSSSFSSSSSTRRKQYSCTSPKDTKLDDALPHDLNTRLSFLDRKHGFSRSNTYSPTPSDISSSTDDSKISSEVSSDKESPVQRSEVTFKVEKPPVTNHILSSSQKSYPFSHEGDSASRIRNFHNSGLTPLSTGGMTNIEVNEENGKKTLTTEFSNVIQEKDGFMETKEKAVDITDANSKASKKEALTRMVKEEADPDGKFKKAEKADMADVSESCVKQLDDGTFVTVQKNTSSSSSTKQSFFTNSGKPGSILDSSFPSNFSHFPRERESDDSFFSRASSDLASFGLSRRFPNFPDFPELGSFSENNFGFPSFSRRLNVDPFGENNTDSDTWSSKQMKSSFSSSSSFFDKF